MTTDAQGRFSASILLSHSAGVTANFYPYDADDDYIAAAQATIAVNVRRPVAFDDYFTVRRSLNPKKPSFWDVKGYLKDASLPGQVQIQSSGSPAGPWTTIGSAGFNGVQPSEGYEFKTEIEIFSRCYVRAYSPTTPHTQPAASKAVFVVGAPPPRRTPVGSGQPVPRRV